LNFKKYVSHVSASSGQNRKLGGCDKENLLACANKQKGIYVIGLQMHQQLPPQQNGKKSGN